MSKIENLAPHVPFSPVNISLACTIFIWKQSFVKNCLILNQIDPISSWIHSREFLFKSSMFQQNMRSYFFTVRYICLKHFIWLGCGHPDSFHLKFANLFCLICCLCFCQSIWRFVWCHHVLLHFQVPPPAKVRKLKFNGLFTVATKSKSATCLKKKTHTLFP